MTEYRSWFTEFSGCAAPHAWQEVLALDPICRDRTLRIPTGFGKTVGAVAAWMWNRVVRQDDTWPHRLVFCLPMRVLVEQTERVLRDSIARIGLEIPVHVLMGGVRAERWVLDLDRPAILIGTQDMLLSRALNRGYASGRALWPMEFGLLHQDALWLFDEVQLMDVGLATSVQLAAFRQRVGQAALRPTKTWWMSATLQPRWLATVDQAEPTEKPLRIAREQRRGGLFELRKPITRRKEIDEAPAVARLVVERHAPGTLTLVIVNRVRRALEVYDALEDHFSESKGRKKVRRADAPDLRLVHSRFRGAERAAWAEDFLRRGAPLPEAGRVIVATQVVEAGVDISARLLVTDLAPWSSLVQRFGRAARYEGESGEIVIAGHLPKGDKDAIPYGFEALAAAEEGIAHLLFREADGSPRSLEAFEEEMASKNRPLLEQLYPYDPLHLLRRRDLYDLFDTSMDLSGADLDVSRFIRTGEERDVRVFWRTLPAGAKEIALDSAPERVELCPVPIEDLKKWKGAAYVFDYLDGKWLRRDVGRLAPGTVVLFNAQDGGYSIERGWDAKAKAIEPVPLTPVELDGLVTASSVDESDALSAAFWKTIATHGRETEVEAQLLSRSLGLPARIAHVVALAARWHDVGKAHPVFQDAIKEDCRATTRFGARRDLSKAPMEVWHRPPYGQRPGFRHELASTLALFELLRRHDPMHPALLGGHRSLLESIDAAPSSIEAPLDHPLVIEVAALSAEEFDLLAYLVCSHHGKVRCAWTSTPHDQTKGHGGIHGVCEGDTVPSFCLPDADGNLVDAPALTLSLAPAEVGLGARYGASWSERIGGLLERLGPFTLAFLEALLRVADWRASKLSTEDPVL